MKIKNIFDVIKQEAAALKGDEVKNKLYSSEHIYPDEQAAGQAFLLSLVKLFAVNNWSDLPGISSTFQVYDPVGNPKQSSALLTGDYICIQLPGPTPQNWVEVADLQITDTVAEFTVSPCESPHSKRTDDEAIDHFFSAESSSTFRVERQGNRLIAREIGLNERINNQGDMAGDRAVVNTVIAEIGWAFFQEMQWKKLTDYLVHL